MTDRRKSKKQLSSYARGIAAGKSFVNLGLPPDSRRLLDEAATVEGRSLAQFISFHAVAAAKKILGKE